MPDTKVNELDQADRGQLPPAHKPKSAPLATGAIIGIAAAVAVATGVLGFVGGMQFQKGSSSSTVANQRGGFGGTMGGGMSRNGSFGEVTAVSDSSITITTRERFNQSSGSNTSTSKTYTINSSTTITVDGSTGSASDIKTGDTVMIEASSSGSSIASSIRVGMGGMGGPQGQQQSSTDSSTDDNVRTN